MVLTVKKLLKTALVVSALAYASVSAYDWQNAGQISTTAIQYVQNMFRFDSKVVLYQATAAFNFSTLHATKQAEITTALDAKLAEARARFAAITDGTAVEKIAAITDIKDRVTKTYRSLFVVLPTVAQDFVRELDAAIAEQTMVIRELARREGVTAGLTINRETTLDINNLDQIIRAINDVNITEADELANLRAFRAHLALSAKRTFGRLTYILCSARTNRYFAFIDALIEATDAKLATAPAAIPADLPAAAPEDVVVAPADAAVEDVVPAPVIAAREPVDFNHMSEDDTVALIERIATMGEEELDVLKKEADSAYKKTTRWFFSYSEEEALLRAKIESVIEAIDQAVEAASIV